MIDDGLGRAAMPVHGCERGEGGLPSDRRRGPRPVVREVPLVCGAPAAGTLVLRVGYRGAGFSGFAAQPGRRTVAGELVRALETFLRRPVELTCAGRTDAGVHALAQHVSVPVSAEELGVGRHRLLAGLSALTPDDVSVSDAWRAAPGFSARFDALSRTYRYRVCDSSARPVLAWDHAWWLRAALDERAMHDAAQVLVGEHDFASFCKASSAVGRPTCRHVDWVRVGRVEECGEGLVAVDVRANAFLHSMVRTIVGTLVEVGRGHRPGTWVRRVLEARDRTAAGPCAPARGLVFQSVEYPDGALAPWGE